MNTIEPILNALSKYSWRSFVGILATSGVLLRFHERLGLSEWYVPVRPWIFGAFFCSGAMLLTYLCTFGIEWFSRRDLKGTVYFVPDGFNVGWSKQHETEMNLRVGGTFTFTGTGEILILRAFLSGREAIGDLSCQCPMADGSGRMMSSDGLRLREGIAQRTYFDVRLTPVLGVPNTTLRRKMLLRDNKNRIFSVGKIDFRYNGPVIQR